MTFLVQMSPFICTITDSYYAYVPSTFLTVVYAKTYITQVIYCPIILIFRDHGPSKNFKVRKE